MKKFYSNGKLLLTGEYLVLDGALALAIPTQFGQSLTIKAIDQPKLIWQSLDPKGSVWFEDEFVIDEMNQVLHANDISSTLIQILNVAKQLNPNFLNSKKGYKVETKLDFPEFWGLGSSSTLISNIAQWAQIDAYKLLELTLGGSGYDIACAQYNYPLTYQLSIKNQEILHAVQNDNRIIKQVDFNPEFKDCLYFVHLNKKQNSREEIANFRSNKNNSELAVSEISDITSKIINCKTLQDFDQLITNHEQILSIVIKQIPVKEQLFNDYRGAIKSLGAWGGDFILVTGTQEMMTYFRQKGFNTVIPFNDMILK